MDDDDDGDDDDEEEFGLVLGWGMKELVDDARNKRRQRNCTVMNRKLEMFCSFNFASMATRI